MKAHTIIASKSSTGLRGRLTALALWLVAFAIACFLAITDNAQASRGKTYIPQDPNLVLEQLPTGMRDPQLVTLRDAHASHPNDVATAVSLARKYIDIGRRNSDPRQFGYAQAAIAAWWQLDSPPLDVRLIRATLLQQRHAFDAALIDLDAIIAADPRSTQALLTRATVLAVQAKYSDAEKSCRPLLLSTGLVGVTCLANAQSMRQPENSIRALQSGLTSLGHDADSATKQWSWTLLAEVAARNNNTSVAQNAFEQALRITPSDSYLLAAYADWLLSNKDWAKAASLLHSSTAIDGLLLRLAIAEKNLNRPIWQTHTQQLQERFDAAIQRGENLHQREYARFWLELKQNPEMALKAAMQNWQVQREALDAEILLLSAQACNKPEAAKPVTDWLVENAITDKKIITIADQLHRKTSP